MCSAFFREKAISNVEHRISNDEGGCRNFGIQHSHKLAAAVQIEKVDGGDDDNNSQDCEDDEQPRGLMVDDR